MNKSVNLILRYLLNLGLLGLTGCAVNREHSDGNYPLHLIYAQRPALRTANLKVQERQAEWSVENERSPQPPISQASYLYSVVRFASDPDSRYRIIIVEQRIPHPGAQPIVTLKDGYARDMWVPDGEGTSTLQSVILSPKLHKPTPQDLE